MLGLKGVLFIKRWLESTTHIDLPFNAYENQAVCTLPLLNGNVKRWDLSGFFLGKDVRPLVVEAKAYSTPGHQGTEYVKYLANAYSATAKEMAEVGDRRREFIWVTSHPFSQKRWKDLLSRDYMHEALKDNADVLGGNEVDDNLVETLADRLWVLVIHQKQESLLLRPKELLAVHRVLKRKG